MFPKFEIFSSKSGKLQPASSARETVKVVSDLPPQTHFPRSLPSNPAPISAHDSFTIFGFIHSQPFNFLVDTGASITAISSSTWRKLGLPVSVIRPSNLATVRTAGGTSLDTIGRFTCNFTINGSIYPFDTYVIRNLSHDVILGTDFLKSFVSAIDMKNFRLHLVPPNPPMPDTPQISTVSLHASDRLLVLPPRSETVFPVRCPSHAGTVGLLTPSHQLFQKYQLLAASILCTVSPSCTVPFRILNPHPYELLLYPNMTLGDFDFCKDISVLDPVSLESSFDPVSRAQSTTWAPSRDFDLSDSCLNDVQKEQLNQLLNEYSDIFATHPHDFGRTYLASHKILVDHSVPIKQRLYRVSHAHKKDVTGHVHDMLQHNIIRPS